MSYLRLKVYGMKVYVNFCVHVAIPFTAADALDAAMQAQL